METVLLICGVVLIVCTAASKLSGKLGLPALLLFLLLGMLFGSDGLLGIAFEDYALAENVCSVCLLFILFYGGFGTNWKVARPVVAKSIWLSTLGVLLTTSITGLCCHWLLGMGWTEGLLLGSVVGSTDAASVFSILRSKRLNLKGGLASLLEIESGSNDPVAYMMTVLVLSFATSSPGAVTLMLAKQMVLGGLFGAAVAMASVWILKHVPFGKNGLHTIFVVGAALLSFSLPTLLGGNGYLSVYLTGLILGNSEIPHKVELVHFFDGVTWLTQISLFFLLGLLSFPSQLPAVVLPAIGVFVILTFVARPAATFILLAPFRVPFRQQLLVSWAGLRGAASIVFAIFCVTQGAESGDTLYHMVLCICLLSVSIQGTLLPAIAKKLGLVDNHEKVLKTFNDYQMENDLSLMQLTIGDHHAWAGKQLRAAKVPPELLIILIEREDDVFIPNGGTVIRPGDRLVLCSEIYREETDARLTEVKVGERHKWANRRLNEITLPGDKIAVLVRHNGQSAVARGDTQILPGDTVVLCGIQTV